MCKSSKMSRQTHHTTDRNDRYKTVADMGVKCPPSRSAMLTVPTASLLLLSALVTLTAAQCPPVHVFGARETTAPPGFGSAGPVVDMVLSSVPGSTSEVINYPACGGQASCGGVSYAQSVIDGVNAVAGQVNTFNTQCPSTVLVLIGYSQVSSICAVITSVLIDVYSDWALMTLLLCAAGRSDLR